MACQRSWQKANPNAKKRPNGSILLPPVPEPTLEVAARTTHAFTVQGVQLALSMLLGRKLLDNRSFRLWLGWYALHVGKRRDSQYGMQATKLYPDLPRDEQLLGHFGAVVGLVRIAERRAPSQCSDNVWALRPPCNVNSHAIRLGAPILQNGPTRNLEAAPRSPSSRKVPTAPYASTRRRSGHAHHPGPSALYESALRLVQEARLSQQRLPLRLVAPRRGLWLGMQWRRWCKSLKRQI